MSFLDDIILIIAILIIVGGSRQLFKILRGDAPFVLSRRRAIKLITDELQLQPNQELWELGAGSAPLLKRLAKKYPHSKFVGLEYLPIPYFVGRLSCLFYRNISLKKADFYQSDLSQADFIYCFLNVRAMAELENKLLTNCKNGAIIISYIFKLPHIEPVKTLQLEAEKIYFYKINQIDKIH